MPRIFMRAEVVPRPTVERAFLHARHIVGYEIVTETISFIGRAPHCARCGLNAESHTVANARREQLAATLGARVEHHDRSTIGLTIHAAPIACEASQAEASFTVFLDMFSPTLPREPMETYMRLPSGENARPRVTCPPADCGASSGTTTVGSPRALKSPVR